MPQSVGRSKHGDGLACLGQCSLRATFPECLFCGFWEEVTGEREVTLSLKSGRFPQHAQAYSGTFYGWSSAIFGDGGMHAQSSMSKGIAESLFATSNGANGIIS